MFTQQTLFPNDAIEPGVEPFPLAVGDLPHRPIILLDLNYTLVANSPAKRKQRGPYIAKIQQETYRLWLVGLLREYYTVLYTVRFEQYRTPTLARIQAMADWQPEEAYFNPTGGYDAPAVKRAYLEQSVFPVHGGPDETAYLALESNQAVRSMLRAQFAIPAQRVGDMRWNALPGADLPLHNL
jgi:hypothetical protein